MKKILSFIFCAVALLSTTSCLKDDYLYDYDNQKAVIEFMTETKASTINCKNMKGVGAAYVNYSISDAKNITEDIHVTVSLDESLIAGKALLPAVAYKLRIHTMASDTYASFPADAVIPAYAKLPDRRPNTDPSNPTENVQLYEANRQSVALVVEIDAEATGIEAGTYYLPLRITSVSPNVAPISGNFGYQIITVNVQ